MVSEQAIVKQRNHSLSLSLSPISRNSSWTFRLSLALVSINIALAFLANISPVEVDT